MMFKWVHSCHRLLSNTQQGPATPCGKFVAAQK